MCFLKAVIQRVLLIFLYFWRIQLSPVASHQYLIEATIFFPTPNSTAQSSRRKKSGSLEINLTPFCNQMYENAKLWCPLKLYVDIVVIREESVPRLLWIGCKKLVYSKVEK